MVIRKGLGKGKGKGYKNIQNNDPRIHKDSSKGIKQPQRVNIEALTRQSREKGKLPTPKPEFVPVEEVSDADIEPSKMKILKEKGAEALKKARAYTLKQIEKRKEKAEAQKIKVLEEAEHPIIKKLSVQKHRVAEIEKQIATEEDEDHEEKLFDELRVEQKQLRELQEKATTLKLEDMSDAELKTLAIRWKEEDEGLLSGIFSTPENPYKKELVMRVRNKKQLEKSLADERKKLV